MTFRTKPKIPQRHYHGFPDEKDTLASSNKTVSNALWCMTIISVIEFIGIIFLLITHG